MELTYFKVGVKISWIFYNNQIAVTYDGPMG